MSTYTVKVSSNGQISVPAEVRRRWGSQRMLVLDRGDQLIVRPIPEDPFGAIVGKYARRMPPSEQMRRTAREEDAEREAMRP